MRLEPTNFAVTSLDGANSQPKTGFCNSGSRRFWSGRRVDCGRLIVATIGLVFAVSGALKMITGVPMRVEHPESIYANIVRQRPEVHYAVAGGELIFGAWLSLGIKSQASCLTAIVVLSAFGGLIITELLKAHPVSCGWLSNGTFWSVRTGLALSLSADLIMMSALIAVSVRLIPAPATRRSGRALMPSDVRR